MQFGEVEFSEDMMDMLPMMPEAMALSLSQEVSIVVKAEPKVLNALSLVRVEPGLVEIELPFREALTQQHGFLHAGAVTSVVDSACGYAALSLMPPGVAVLTVEFKINLLAPARGERMLAQGQVLKAGRTLMVSQGDVWAFEGGLRKAVATMTATVMVVRDRGIED